MQESERVAVLTLGGGDKREIGAEGLRAEHGTVAETDLAEDDRQSEALLGMVVGGLHAVDIEEGEDSICIAFGVDDSLSEIFAMGIVQARPANGIEFALQLRLAIPGPGEGDPT